MKTLKLALILFAGSLFLNACGGLSPRKVTEIPTGADYKQVYDKLVETLKVEPMLYEIKGTFRPGPSGSSASADFAAIVSVPDNKGLFQYSFNIVDAIWGGPDQVTLKQSTGRGGSTSVNYDDFKEFLFSPSEFPFDKLDGLYAKAIDASGFGKENCHITQFKMEKSEEGKLDLSFIIQPKDGKTFKKEIWLDKDGNVVKTYDYDSNS